MGANRHTRTRCTAVAFAALLVASAIALTACAGTSGTGTVAGAGTGTGGTTSSPGSTVTVGPASVSGFEHPTAIVAPDDGSGRIFVTNQPGEIRVVKDGGLLPTPALDIRSRVGSLGNEDGLLGLAFPPNFAAKRYAYIYFTDPANTSMVYRVHVSATDPNIFDPATMQLILSVKQPYANHKGGQLAFGPDGYLYFGLGDGGSGGDPGNRGQSLSTLLGRILRIDVESTPDAVGYKIPQSNPFVTTPGARPEIWLYGLRNPWRFSFDTGTGDLWIGDVGQDRWEEIDLVSADSTGGLNFGWSQYEGAHLFKASSIKPGFSWPVAEYSHSEGQAVTGGFVYRGDAYPAMRGLYVFADYSSGTIWTLSRSGGKWVRTAAQSTSHKISTFGTDGKGELWLADWAAGTIVRVGDLSR